MVHTKRMLGMLGILSVLALTVGLVGCKKDKVDNTQGTVDLVGTWEEDTMCNGGFITKSGELMWVEESSLYGKGFSPYPSYEPQTVTVTPERKVTITGGMYVERKYISHHWNDNILTVKIKMQKGTQDTVFECSFFVKDDCLYGPLTDKPLTKEGKEKRIKEKIEYIEMTFSTIQPPSGKLSEDNIKKLNEVKDSLNKMLESSEGVYEFYYVFKKKK